MRHKPLVIAVVTAAMGLAAVPAYALPGDPAIDDLSPYRLDNDTLEPGCFEGEAGLPQNLSDHIDLGLLDAGSLGEDLHVSLDHDADASVDQVLVADGVGYKVYNTFDTGSRDDDPDVDPRQTGTDMNGFTASGTTSVGDTIVCVSDHGDAGQNEPYSSRRTAWCRPRIGRSSSRRSPRSALSAIDGLNTFKVGFGYETEQWYSDPEYDGRSAFDTVTDPNAFPSPTDGGDLPALVNMFPRQDGAYDTRRVNDFDDAREPWAFGDPSDGQTVFFNGNGDDTAWSDPQITNNAVFNLLSTTTEGDLPLVWTLRSSLAAPSSERSVEFTDDDYRAWNKSWQDFYAGKGPKPSMPLAPGTNSPEPDDSITVIVNPPQVAITVPPATPAAAPQVIQVPAPAAAAPRPAAPAQADSPSTCESNRAIKFTWSSSAKSGRLVYRGRSVSARRSGGKLRATADLRGMTGHPGSYMKIIQKTTSKRGKKSSISRSFKVC